MQNGASTASAPPATPGQAPADAAKTAQRIGVPREIYPGEKRVATVPEVLFCSKVMYALPMGDAVSAEVTVPETVPVVVVSAFTIDA